MSSFIINVSEIAEEIKKEFPNHLTNFEALQIACKVQRNEIEHERNEVLKVAFVVRSGFPSALEKIAMELSDK